MKRAISITTALTLALALSLALAPSALADSQAYGGDVWLQDTPLQDGVVLSDNIFWSDYYSQPRHEYYITYTPGAPGGGAPAAPFLPSDFNSNFNSGFNGEPSLPGTTGQEQDIPDWLLQSRARAGTFSGVIPVAAYGSSVCDRLTAEAAARYYEGLGYRVLGVINGDFYDMSSGYPLGLLISDGQLLSGSSEYYAAGFRADGSAVMGEPKLSITARADTGQSVTVWSINKPRVEKGGVALLTYYFRGDHGTATAAAGVNVLAKIIGGRASIGEQLIVQVEEVLEESASYTLREDQVLLSAAASAYGDALGFLRSLVPGQTVTVSFTTPDPDWNDVTEAVGAMYLLVDGGAAQSGFEVSAAPRTAVGVKANGDIVLYTIDGRQTAHSMGASLGVLAKRMAELGCVTALCLDGGGSTTIVGSTPDRNASRTLNSPSDKALRKVSNHIVLLAPGGMTGQPRIMNLSAAAPAVLAGHTVRLNANLADSHYYPMTGDIQFAASAGEIQGNVFTAPDAGGAVTVTAWSGQFAAQVGIQVLDEPDEVTLQRGGAAVSSLTVTPGETVQLGLSASYRHQKIEVFPTDFTWKITPGLGTIDENGVLTAALSEGKGYITAGRGNCSVTVPLTVYGGSPFVDTDGHWAETYMKNLYYQGILAGITENGQLYAYPDKGVTRAEFSVLLARYLGLDTALYAGTETPFPDLAPVESWAGGAIRAMYGMGIVNGSEANGQVVFDPQGMLTRSQAAAMLGRMLADEGPVLPGEENDENNENNENDGNEKNPVIPVVPAADLSRYADADQIPDYAVEHFQTLVALGAVDADGEGRLEPNELMTRAAVCRALSVLTPQMSR